MKLLFLAALLFTQLALGDVFEGKVVGVADGDTVTVLDSTQTPQKIRLEGLDAPEKKQAYGAQAKAAMSQLAFGKQAEVVWRKRDRYGRVLGKVLVEGQDVGLEMIRSGLGWHYKQYSKQQDKADQQIYSQAELDAREQKRGLWNDSDPIAPWEFRSNKRLRNKPIAKKPNSTQHPIDQHNASQ
jgi:endonuclease YncB( thermonuclease family)